MYDLRTVNLRGMNRVRRGCSHDVPMESVLTSQQL